MLIKDAGTDQPRLTSCISHKFQGIVKSFNTKMNTLRFEDIVSGVQKILQNIEAPFVLVGGAALILADSDRLTSDIDLLIPHQTNPSDIISALAEKKGSRSGKGNCI